MVRTKHRIMISLGEIIQPNTLIDVSDDQVKLLGDAVDVIDVVSIGENDVTVANIEAVWVDDTEILDPEAVAGTKVKRKT